MSKMSKSVLETLTLKDLRDLFDEALGNSMPRPATKHAIVSTLLDNADTVVPVFDRMFKTETEEITVDAVLDELYSEVEVLVKEASEKQGKEFRNEIKKVASKMSEARIMEIAQKAVNKGQDVLREVTIFKGDMETRKVKGVMPPEFERLVQLASCRRNIFMVGPTGCGKTFVAEKIAEALGMEFSALSVTEGISENMLSGWLLPLGKGGQFVYVAAEFINKFEHGGVFLLDEMDKGDPNVLAFLNSALANGYIFLPQRHDNPVARRHNDFVCIGAANTWGHGATQLYVGSNQLDEATLDRFRAGMVFMDYNANVEESIIATDVLAWGRAVRNGIRELGLERVMSTRFMQDMTVMKDNYDWSRPEWEKAYFAAWSDDERNRIQGYLPM